MKNTLKINHTDRTITMDRTFAKNAENTRSEEYAHLQRVRNDYPTYTVVRRQIKKNPNKECWKGLTYTYMENYIITHEEGENRVLVLKEFAEKRLISECHSNAHRYPVIKNWFLTKYPEIAKFGIDTEVETDNVTEEEKSKNVYPMAETTEQPMKISA